MTTSKYEDELKLILEYIEIAIDSFQSCPPKKFDSRSLQLALNYYKDERKKLLHPEPRYATLKSLGISKRELLTYFQEGAGENVEYFWTAIKRRGLPLKRDNRLRAIINRRKIRNASDFDLVIDLLVPYQQEGLISVDDVELLNNLISEYESKARRVKKSTK